MTQHVYMVEDEFFETEEAALDYKKQKGFKNLIDRAVLNVPFADFLEAFDRLRIDPCVSQLDAFRLAADGYNFDEEEPD